MVQRKQQLKFERNPRIRNRDNCDTDAHMTDGRRTNFNFMSSAAIVQAELKWHLLQHIAIGTYKHPI